MRNPVRSETDAFRIAFGGAVLIGVSAGVAVLVAPLAGMAAFALVVLGALTWEFATKDPDRRRPLREAALAGRQLAGRGGRERDRARVLVVANRTLADVDLRAAIRRHASAGSELRIVVPILVSRVRYMASDVDRELEQARSRLEQALAWAASEQIAVTGTIGDPFTALGAIEDELRRYAADEVIISTLAPGRSNWLETGIVERLREETEIPVTHIVREGTRQPSAQRR